MCGSTRYAAQFAEANVELTKRGLSVITVSMYLPRDMKTGDQKDQGLKDYLDLVHLNKILMADAIFVVGEDGYIGRSTAKEILWAY